MNDPYGVGLSAEELDTIEGTLVCGIRNFMAKNGFTRTHLGLSGGIDSALAAYLAVKAVGSENVVCINMPSRFSSQGSKDHAALLAAKLGCRYETLPIETIFSSCLSTLEWIFEGKPMDVTEENLQARIRGMLLMAYSNKFNSLLLAGGNKSEIAMGYCTLYGDTAGGLAPIGDLFKTEVFALCKRINDREINTGRKEIIPEAIIEKPPSAELKPNQKDEDFLPPYDILDEILKLYFYKKLSAEEIVERGTDPELTAWIIRTAAWADFKRRQMPPVLRISLPCRKLFYNEIDGNL